MSFSSVALVAARLDGPFRLYARGRLRSTGSPASAVTIIELEPSQSYTFAVPLLLAELRVRRTLAATPTGTRSTHEVAFVGLLGGLFGRLLGRRFQRMLPGVMEQLRQLAEQPCGRTAAA